MPGSRRARCTCTFPSKQELFKAVVRTRLSALIAEGQQVMERFDGSGATLLRALMQSWWQRVGSTAAGGIFKIIVAEVRNFPELAQFYNDEVVVPAQRLIAATLQRGIERGEFRDVPLAQATHTLIAPLLFLALHKHSIGACAVTGPALDAEALIDTHIDLMLHGLQAAPQRRVGPPGATQGHRMKMARWTRWGLVLLAVAAVAVGASRWFAARHAAQTVAAPVAKAPAVLELAPTDLITVHRGELTRTLEVSGSLVAVNSAFVKARVAAEIKSVAVREGDSVRVGQLLVQLDTTEFDWRLRQAEQQAQAARAQLDIAQRTLQNNKSLMAQGFISATAMENAVSNEAGAQATLQAALAGVELARKARGDATVSAPIAGFVAQRLVQPGERVPVDARLLEIVDLSRLELQASVPPDDAGKLRVGATAQLQVDGIDGGVTARVVRINPSAQPGSRSVLAYLELQPHPALRQGLFARGSIELERRMALTLPLSAVRTDGAQPYALRLDGPRVGQRPLGLGARGQTEAGESIEVLQGLAEGDQVLLGSVGTVRDGTAVRVTSAPAGAASAAR